MYDNPATLQAEIDRYFKEGIKTKSVIVGKAPNTQVVEIEVPTITGLCMFLGFESRQSFYDYEAKQGFAYTIKRARLFIENHYEELLQSGNMVGAIFALKNFDWKDKQEISQEVKITDPVVTQVEIIHTNGPEATRGQES